MERYRAGRREQNEPAEFINAYLGGRGNIVRVEVCVTQTHAQFAFQLTSHMNQGLWWSGCGIRPASKLCRLNAYPSMHSVASSPYRKIMKCRVCCEKPEHFNLSALPLVFTSQTRLSLSSPTSLYLSMLMPSISDPPPPFSSSHSISPSLHLSPHQSTVCT